VIELRKFVARALLDIVGGVEDAQNSVQSPAAIISPIDGNYEPRLEPVEFDIEVTTAESSGEKGGFGIFVASVALGGQAQSDSRTTSAGRIRFKVHVELPVQQQDRAIAEKYRKRFEKLALDPPSGRI
jgi:hypothetical protein